ncbi:MAG: hypothetical protein JJE47_07545, partial [Acidimicrobiia bacterium]|nr:hypothetical protein [Acidimicrobiia bacterium]
NLGKQYGLIRKTEVSMAPSSTWRVYGIVAAITGLSIFVGYGTALNLTVRMVLFVLLSLAGVVFSRNILDVEDTFPSLGKLPLIKYLVK